MTTRSVRLAVGFIAVTAAAGAWGSANRATLRAAPGVATATASAPAAKNVTIKRQLLAEHQTVARLSGIAYQRCRGLTALCPDNCGDSGDFATFTIVGYVKYNKVGEYGDDKARTYSFQVNDNRGTLKISKEYADKVRALKPGDYVVLHWNQEYVTREEDGTSASYPERPLTKVEPITQAEAEKLLAGAK